MLSTFFLLLFITFKPPLASVDTCLFGSLDSVHFDGANILTAKITRSWAYYSVIMQVLVGFIVQAIPESTMIKLHNYINK